VDENGVYELRTGGREPLVRLGSEMIAGVELTAGEWVVRRINGR
jgi:hypothetical protein